MISLEQINENDPVVQNATVGMKFSQKTILLKSFLDQHKIPYEESELTETPCGLGIILDENQEN